MRSVRARYIYGRVGDGGSPDCAIKLVACRREFITSIVESKPQSGLEDVPPETMKMQPRILRPLRGPQDDSVLVGKGHFQGRPFDCVDRFAINFAPDDKLLNNSADSNAFTARPLVIYEESCRSKDPSQSGIL